MKTEDIKKMAQAWNEVQEAKKKKLDPVGKADADIDNDGDVDSSDKYLHNRRKAIKKAMKKDSKGTETEVTVSEEKMTDAQKKKREEIVLSMKDKTDEFKKKYGDRWKDVMYATATKMAMKEDVEQVDENRDIKQPGPHPDLVKAGIKHDHYQSVFKRSKTHVDVDKKDYEKAKKVLGNKLAMNGGSVYLNVKESVNLDEISKEKAADYKKKSVEYSKDALRSNDPKKLKKIGNRIAGAGRATKILNKESVDLDEANAPKATHTPNNGSDPDQGLSPSAKKEKERKTPISPEVDEPKVDAMNFKTFRNMTKASPKRSNDQTIGDKTMPKNDGK